MRTLSEITWVRLWWVGVTLLLALTFLLKPIVDPDFFWHLHHGQWLWEHGALPTTDPFALRPPAEVTPRQYYILTSYWLAQWGYYGIYTLSGWSGFFLLRVVLLLVMIWSLMARAPAARLVNSLLAATLLVVIFARFPVERPQFFSIVAFAILLALLERLRSKPAPDYPAYLGIPFLLLLWGNLHGGVLVGQILCLFALGLAVRAAWTPRNGMPAPALVLIAALLLSLASPTGFNHLSVMVESTDARYREFYTTIREYDHLGTAIFTNKAWGYALFPVMTLLAYFGLIRDGVSKNLPHLLLLTAFAAAAFSSVRYLPFLGILALPSAAAALGAFRARRVIPVLVVGFALCAFAGSGNFANLQRLLDDGPVSPLYPRGAAAYIKQQGLHGQVLNNFIWGGYLRFLLGPGHEMFVDGRTLDIDRYRDYNRLLSLGGGAENVPAFRALLEKYRFDYIVLPKSYQGQPLWMNWALSQLPDWRLGYDDGMAVVHYRVR